MNLVSGINLNSTSGYFSELVSCVSDNMPTSLISGTSIAVVAGVNTIAIAYVAKKCFTRYALTNYRDSETIYQLDCPRVNKETVDFSQIDGSNIEKTYLIKVMNPDTKQWENACIHYRIKNKTHCFDASTCEEGKESVYIGNLNAQVLEEEDKKTVVVSAIENMSRRKEFSAVRYKYVGCQMMKAVFQTFQELGLNVRLRSANSSAPFYYKLGMRSESDRTNAAIASRIASGDDEESVSALFILRPWAQQKWREELAQNPLPLAE